MHVKSNHTFDINCHCDSILYRFYGQFLFYCANSLCQKLWNKSYERAENDSAAIHPLYFSWTTYHICSLLNMNLSTYLNIITYCIRHSRWDPPRWLIVGESKSISMHTQLGSMISEVWNLIPHNFTNNVIQIAFAD